MIKIVVLDGHPLNPGDNPFDALQEFGNLVVHPNTSDDEVVDRSRDADIVLTNKVKLNASTLDQLPILKMIGVMATGYDVVDINAAKARGIVVCNVPEYSTASVAQHVFALLLSYLHQPEGHHQEILNGGWQQAESFSFWQSPLYELSGKTIGIVGLGRIGQATAKLAQAFGMSVIATSRTSKTVAGLETVRQVSMDELFANADVVSLHCPLTDSTQQMIDASMLAKMQEHAILINTARGGLIHESDLADCLKRGDIGAALLDVVSTEPIAPDNPLLDCPRCLMTPHLSWATLEARKRLMNTLVNNVEAFLNGHPSNVIG